MLLSLRWRFSDIVSLLHECLAYLLNKKKKPSLLIKPQSYDIYETLARKYKTKAIFQVHWGCILDKIQDPYKNNNKINWDIFLI